MAKAFAGGVNPQSTKTNITPKASSKDNSKAFAGGVNPQSTKTNITPKATTKKSSSKKSSSSSNVSQAIQQFQEQQPTKQAIEIPTLKPKETTYNKKTGVLMTPQGVGYSTRTPEALQREIEQQQPTLRLQKAPTKPAPNQIRASTTKEAEAAARDRNRSGFSKGFEEGSLFNLFRRNILGQNTGENITPYRSIKSKVYGDKGYALGFVGSTALDLLSLNMFASIGENIVGQGVKASTKAAAVNVPKIIEYPAQQLARLKATGYAGKIAAGSIQGLVTGGLGYYAVKEETLRQAKRQDPVTANLLDTQGNQIEEAYRAGLQAREEAYKAPVIKKQEQQQFKEVKSNIRTEVRNTLIEEGYSGEELTILTNRYTDMYYQQTLTDYYQGRGYSFEEARDLVSEAIGGRGTEGAVNVPLTNNLFNPQSILGDISLFFGKDSFEKGVKEYWEDKGYSGKELQARIKATMAVRTSEAAGEIGGFISIGSATEMIGGEIFAGQTQKLAEKGVQVSTKQSTGLLFKEGFKAIAPAGFIEGSVGEIITQQARREDQNIKDIAVSGSVGALSAGLIGGTISGTRLSKPKISKVVEVGSYLTDPYEYAGDKVADLTEKLTGQVVPKPKIRVSTQIPTSLVSFGGVNANIPTIQASNIFNPTEINNLNNLVGVNVQKNVRSKSQVPTNINNIINSNIPIATQVPVNPNIPVNINPNIPVNINPNIPVNPQVPTNIPTNIPVNIPVISPQLKIPPPVPLTLPFGSGGSGAGNFNTKKYLNELGLGASVLGASFKGNVPQPKARNRSKKRSSKKSSNRIPQPRINLPRGFPKII